jgi:hypothetical protein
MVVMGAWGTGPFDNDDAGDWVYELEEARDLGFVRQTLTTALEADDYLELPEGNNAVAAALVIAASLDRSYDRLPEEVVAWFNAGREAATAEDARLAILALDRVTGEESETAELWGESPSGEEWSNVVAVLRQRLAQGAS